jgi:redox-sensitive bicupin YhaK (pirin superfamily)
MITIRRSLERGQTQLDWLKSFHTFSFGDYHNSEHMGFGVLRVINEDWISPKSGFGTHPHRNMEILTYVLEGTLEHQDSLGHETVIYPGEVQKMTAGTGVFHSEANPHPEIPLHLLQIWIRPNTLDLPPSYQQVNFQDLRTTQKMTLLASEDGRDGSIMMHQDINVFVIDLLNEQFILSLDSNRIYWLHVVRGDILLNGLMLQEGDGCAIVSEEVLEIISDQLGEILLFDMPA